MSLVLPEEITYGKITGRFLIAIGDTPADPDNLPDPIAAEGDITFTPLSPIRRILSGSPVTVVKAPIRASLDENGVLVDAEGNEGVWLVAGEYSVTYALAGVAARIPGHAIVVSDGGVIDLTPGSPPQPAPNQPLQVVQVPPGYSEGSGLVSDGVGGFRWAPMTGGGGVTTHNDLTDRGASDAHPIDAITGLQSALDGKADGAATTNALAGKANTSHTHAASDITSGTLAEALLPSSSESAKGIVELATAAEASTGSDTARALTPAAARAANDARYVRTVNGNGPDGSGNVVVVGGTTDHSALTNRSAADQHPIDAITGLTSALASKADTTALTSGLAGKANTSHAHGAGDITSGTLDPARLPDATDTAKGIVELATAAETTAGADATRAVSPAGFRTAGDARWIRTVNGNGPDSSGNVVVAGGGGGTTDHSALTNRSAADQHPVSAITGLQTALDGKAASSHTHSASDISSGTLAEARLPSASDTAKGIVELATAAETTAGTDTARAVTPAGARAANDARYVRAVNGNGPDGSGNVVVAGGTTDHTALSNRDAADQHPIDAITGLTSALSGKAASSHTHSGADITSGTLDPARLPNATESGRGAIEIATTAEVQAGADTERAVTPAGFRAAADARYVRTVNGVAPNPSGNVVVSGSGGGGITEEHHRVMARTPEAEQYVGTAGMHSTSTFELTADALLLAPIFLPEGSYDRFGTLIRTAGPLGAEVEAAVWDAETLDMIESFDPLDGSMTGYQENYVSFYSEGRWYLVGVRQVGVMTTAVHLNRVDVPQWLMPTTADIQHSPHGGAVYSIESTEMLPFVLPPLSPHNYGAAVRFRRSPW